MTKKEKIIVGLLQEACAEFKQKDQKDLIKFIYTINRDFESMSPFSWSEHYGGRRFKSKIKSLYSKK
jgi:hypothetical protein